MKFLFAATILLFATNAWSHIPALLLPVTGTPITTYYIGQSEISRAVYSELTNSDDFFVINLSLKPNEETSIEMLTPVCDDLPQYERFQPRAIVLKGELPWKIQGESNADFISRLEKLAELVIESHYSGGDRPTFYEEFGNTYYWKGGKWQGVLESGLYSIVVYDKQGNKGNFTVGLNQKEAWNPDLYDYVAQVLPRIKAGLCDPNGYTGKLNLHVGGAFGPD